MCLLLNYLNKCQKWPLSRCQSHAASSGAKPQGMPDTCLTPRWCLPKLFPIPGSFPPSFETVLVVDVRLGQVLQRSCLWFSGKKWRGSPALPSESSGKEEQVRLLSPGVEPPWSQRGCREQSAGSGVMGARERSRSWPRRPPMASRPHGCPASAAWTPPWTAGLAPLAAAPPQLLGQGGPRHLWPLRPADPAHPTAPAPQYLSAAPRTSAPPSLLPRAPARPHGRPRGGHGPAAASRGPAERTHLDAQRILPSGRALRWQLQRRSRPGVQGVPGGLGTDTGGGGAEAVRTWEDKGGHGRCRLRPDQRGGRLVMIKGPSS